jgi:NAD-dependent deacetylase
MYDHKTSNLDVVHDIGYDDIKIGDKCKQTGSQLRPHVVWFGEMPFEVDEAYDAIMEADIVMIVGTSLQIGYTITMLGTSFKKDADVYYIDPKPANYLDSYNTPITYIKKKAVEGVTDIVDILIARKDETKEA